MSLNVVVVGSFGRCKFDQPLLQAYEVPQTNKVLAKQKLKLGATYKDSMSMLVSLNIHANKCL
jgi:hypothetical protein